jgi:hypothetical protein
MNGNGNNGDNGNMPNNQVENYINNNRINLNAPGNQGRYTRSRHFQTLEEWDIIFNHIRGCPTGVYDTADFLQNRMLQQMFNDGNLAYNTFPEIVWIPLPCSAPNFRRCILHVEAVNRATGYLTGSFIAIEVTYHDNHPIAQAFTRMFQVAAQHPPMFQSNEDLVLMTVFDNASMQRMCECLTKSGHNFAEFDAMHDPNRIEDPNLTSASRHILHDPNTLQRANDTVARMTPRGGDMSLEESQRLREVWGSIVFPETTPQERRDAYARYAADQINIHRYLRIHWAHEYPDHPNPILLPFNDFVRENNPVDHNRAFQMQQNQYIQALYDGQNNDERARIAATDIRLQQNEIPIQDQAAEPAIPALPVNRLLEYDG